MQKDEILAIEYELASKAWIYEGESFWSAYNVMLAINTALIGIMGLVVSSSNELIVSRLEIIVIVLSIGGTFFSLIWMFTVTRRAAFYRYWIDKLQQIECALVHPTTMRGIGNYFERKPLRRFYQRIGVFSVSYLVPPIFFAGYAGFGPLFFGLNWNQRLSLFAKLIILASFVIFGLYQTRSKRQMYFTKNNKVHKHPTPLLPSCCKVQYANESLHDSLPAGYKKCKDCFSDLGE